MKEDKVWDKLIEQNPINEEVKLFDVSLEFAIKRQPELVNKYEQKRDQVLRILDELDDEYNIKFKEHYHNLRMNGIDGLQLKDKEIREIYLPCEPELIEIKKRIRMYQYTLNFFNYCLKQANQMYWNIKALIDEKKVN